MTALPALLDRDPRRPAFISHRTRRKGDAVMSELSFSRRSLLVGSSALALSTAAHVPSAANAIPAQPMPMWAVGTSDDWNYRPIRAPDAETARRLWVSEHIGGMECDIPDDEKEEDGSCECEWCMNFASADAQRQPAWDGKTVEIGDELWLASGLGAYCSKCGYECSTDDGAEARDGKPFCQECIEHEGKQT